MSFRHGSQRDDRRRRVLADEARTTAAPGEDTREPRAGAALRRRTSFNRYGESALMDGQPRVTDLVPKKISTLFLLLLGALAVVAGLEALYAWMPELAAHTSDGRVAAFDLDSEGSLAVWFSSGTLALAAAAALVVYSVRRTRQDDYHGRYRIWLWAALCWFTMSVDEAASLHEGFKEMMVWLTGRRLLGDGSIWWVAAYLPLLGAVGLRLFLEMRECKASTALLCGTAACYAVAVAAQLEWLLPQSGARGVMLEEGCEMVGNVLLLLSMAVHARHVILEAEGASAAKGAKKKLRQTAEGAKGKAAGSEAPPEGEGSRTPVAGEPARPAAGKPAAPADVALRGGTRVDPPAAPLPQHKLSKAERRALRKQQRSDGSYD